MTDREWLTRVCAAATIRRPARAGRPGRGLQWRRATTSRPASPGAVTEHPISRRRPPSAGKLRGSARGVRRDPRGRTAPRARAPLLRRRALSDRQARGGARPAARVGGDRRPQRRRVVQPGPRAAGDRTPARGGRGLREGGADSPRVAGDPRAISRARSRRPAATRRPRRPRASCIARDGTFAKAWFILALALETQGRMLEALDAATRAAGLAPDRGGLCRPEGAARDRHRRAGEGAPDARDGARAAADVGRRCGSSLGSARIQAGRPAAAAADAYGQVLRVDPDARRRAVATRVSARRGSPIGSDRGALVERYRAGGRAAGVPLLSPFAFLSLPSTRAEQRECAQTWTAAAGRASAAAAPARRCRAARLRIGYLSADFHSHATAFLAAGLFEQHDRARFEVVGYSTGPDDRSPMRARLVRAFDRFVDLRGRDPFAIADTIRSDGIDILVDLKGHTEGATPIVLARRPGADPGALPGLPGHARGRPRRLPDRRSDRHAGRARRRLRRSDRGAARLLPDQRPRAADRRDAPARGTRPARRRVVFVSFNQTYKINPQVFDAWMAILRAVPGCGALAADEARRRSGRSPTCGAKRRRAASIPRASCSRGTVRTPSTSRCTGTPTSSSTRGRTTRTRRRATRCGRAVRC